MGNVLGWEIIKANGHKYEQLCIEHNGQANWAELQAVKNHVWGANSVAFEIYPPASEVLNGESKNFHCRHLWLATDSFNWPNIRTP